ncbi:hypothetical protein C9374_005161 [Naegleria lovaniensis]|uniref:Uncharacterized protein n=1 Tax=Naegleria lovaniensis TaxID=51637 RepID=A0AA88KNH9_NAELO|nr:uncharacterized protein C9374_005161 [Naegleria lovaniensis]KAG2382581.1 hypothetical protein C9374_005161 [Naegleria lovaniensis]
MSITIHNNTQYYIHVVLSQVGPLYDAVIPPGQEYTFQTGRVYFTISATKYDHEEQCNRISTADIALPIVGLSTLVGVVATSLAGLGVGIYVGISTGALAACVEAGTISVCSCCAAAGVGAAGTGTGTAASAVGVVEKSVEAGKMMLVKDVAGFVKKLLPMGYSGEVNQRNVLARNKGVHWHVDLMNGVLSLRKGD